MYKRQVNSDASVGKSFNFYATGDAPNFFQGSTYIGGTATRNTRELWESLLTEEQKEQLSAGTLAIPANVSTPGDGSFVRQWWYDQQSAEDQALIRFDATFELTTSITQQVDTSINTKNKSIYKVFSLVTLGILKLTTITVSYTHLTLPTICSV